MKQFIRIAFQDAVFQVPSMAIASHRALQGQYGAAASPEQLTAELQSAVALFEDPQEIINYAANNMTWDDLKAQAIMISCAEPDRSLKQSLAFREWDFFDEPLMPAELAGDMEEVPLGLVLAHLIAQGASCNVMTIGNPPTYAVAMMTGSVEEIGGYINGLRCLSQMVHTKRDDAANEPSRIILPH